MEQRAGVEMLAGWLGWEAFEEGCVACAEERRKIMRRGAALEAHSRECFEVLDAQRLKLEAEYGEAAAEEAARRGEWYAARA